MLAALAGSLLAWVSASAHAQSSGNDPLVQRQFQLLQRLSPDQQEALIEQYRQSTEARAGGSDQLQGGALADRRRQVVEELEGPPSIQGGDQIIISVERTGEEAGTASDSGQSRRNDNEPERPSFIQDMMGSRTYVVGRDGRLRLEGFDPIALLGLRAPAVAQRLAAEPLLRGLSVSVTILPIRPSGADALERFGAAFFESRRESTDELRAPLVGDYVVGPGDTILVQLYGKENLSYSLDVDREGRITIPQIGQIGVAGMRFDQVRDDVEARLAQQMIGVRSSVSLDAQRGVQVFLAGDVEMPGAYVVDATTTVSGLLVRAGGIRESGSFRDVQVLRNGRLVSRLDMYDLLLQGKTRNDVRLESGDAVFVTTVGTVVRVNGEVNRPAIYELEGRSSVAKVIEMAGGMQADAKRSQVKLRRLGPDGVRLFDIDFSDPRARDTAVQDGDTLTVLPTPDAATDVVYLSGHVVQEGPSEWRPGMRLTDLIPTASLLGDRADLSYVLVISPGVNGRQMTVRSTDWARAFADPGSAENLQLGSRDEVLVFDRSAPRADLVKPIVERLRQQARSGAPEQVVRITGTVPFSGYYPLEPGMRISDVLRAGGGLSQETYRLEAELVRREITDNGERVSTRRLIDLQAVLGGEPEADLQLQPFDIVQLRRIPGWEAPRVVEIGGAVRFPGTYTATEGESLADLVSRAGGLTEAAYPDGAVFLRDALRKEERQQLERLRRRLRSDVALLTARDSRSGGERPSAEVLSTVISVLDEASEADAAGRLVIDLSRQLRNEGVASIRVEDGDNLFVPERPTTVTVVGEVQFPTSHMHEPSLRRDAYLGRSGGLTSRAAKDRIYIIRANGRVDVAGRGLFRGNPEIRPGDTIVVPPDVTSLPGFVVWSNITQILSQIAVSAAAFRTIGVF